ncbi:MAG: hypothetical protein RLZZ196_3482 [Bacteroidota bacterium]|jgi:hypothetical protein
MDILSEIIEVSHNMIDTLDENGFFENNPFIERLPLKRKLQEAMQRKWEQEEDIYLNDNEFEQVCKSTMDECVSSTIEDLVDKGALDMSIGEDGEILYSANKDFNFDKLDEDEFQ